MGRERAWVLETRLAYATCSYSWITPTSRSRLVTAISPVTDPSSGRSRAAWARDLCGRWVLMGFVLGQDLTSVAGVEDEDSVEAFST
jgi:hypothetical protein